MKRKLMTLFLAAAMSVSLVACSGGSDSGDADSAVAETSGGVK